MCQTGHDHTDRSGPADDHTAAGDGIARTLYGVNGDPRRLQQGAGLGAANVDRADLAALEQQPAAGDRCFVVAAADGPCGDELGIQAQLTHPMASRT